MKFSNGWLKIFEIQPHPQNIGECFLAYQKKFAREIVLLFDGLTTGGAKTMIKDFMKGNYDSDALLRGITNGVKHKCLIPLKSR